MCEACERGAKLEFPKGECTDCGGELYPTGIRILTASAPTEFICIGCEQTYCIPVEDSTSRIGLAYFPFLKDRVDKRLWYKDLGLDGG